MRRGPKPAKSKEAKPSVARKPPKDGAQVRDLEKRLAEAQQREAEALKRETEAREQQTATSEILRVIGSSPTNVQPVFDAIVTSAVRLLNGVSAIVAKLIDDSLHLAAFTTTDESGNDAVRGYLPRALADAPIPALVVRDRAPRFVSDIETDPRLDASIRRVAHARGYRSSLTVPMLQNGRPIGVITVTRRPSGPFAAEEIALLQTFADQAVIAIENVRLFKELEARNRDLTEANAQVTESLEQQTATGEILGVISSSPTDVQPVFDTIVRSAVRLSGAAFGALYRSDGEVLELVAQYNFPSTALEWARQNFPRPVVPGGPVARAIHERDLVHFEDIEGEPWAEAPAIELAHAMGYRAGLCVPMLRDASIVGVLAVARVEALLFPQSVVELLKTFADQAVIAIENVRLFKELQNKNSDLTESLERQTATGEILRVISSSPTDTQPVFDIIAANAARLCAARDAQVLRVEGDVLRLVSAYGSPSMPPVRTISRGHGVGRAVIDRQTIHVRDMAQAIAEFPETSAPQHGVESMLAVPLVREDVAVGVIRVSRTQRQPFTEQQIALLETFADQAVIAIENVRLFKELEARNHDLTESLDRQTATAEILSVISGAQTDAQPVFDTIAQSAARLCDAYDAAIFLVDGDVLRLTAHNGPIPAHPLGQGPPLVRGTPPGRSVMDRQTIHVLDMQAELAEYPEGSAIARRFGHRTVLIVPLLRAGDALGVIALRRTEVRPFADSQIALMETFADQAVIAIENVRLFKELQARNREIEDKSRQLEVASQHKSEFLANMSHELRTPLNAIIGFSEVLSERMFGELNEKQEEYLKDIYASGTHLLSLINDVLDLSKIEAGRMELELSDFHLPTALDSALTLVRERAGRRGIALQMNVDSQLGQIQADERKVRQVVLNLLSNAIKFTPEGGRIEVRAEPRDDLVEVSVNDTGVGIAPEDQEAVFEEFRQVGTADKKVEGTGLGLTLCRKFVELHRGKIWVKSELGMGSTFTFTIPFAP